MDELNLSTIRQSFANSVFTHKVQEIAAENQGKKAFYIKIANILIVFVVLVTLFFQTKFPQIILLTYIGAGITIGEIIFLIVQLTFSFDDKKLTHKNSALKFLGLRDNYRLLITDIMNGNITKKELIARRDSLQNEYRIICELAPPTGKDEYNEAQKRLTKRGLVQGEEFTWSDEEIDRFLPEELRFKKKNKR